jgi:Flp pilus assembly pilin Flp
LARLGHDDSGVTAIEYGLIAGLIGVAATSVMGVVARDLGLIFSSITANL